MSLSVRRHDEGGIEVPFDLQRMLKRVDQRFRTEVKPELRKRRWFVGPGEARRLKARRAAHRHRPK